MGGHRAGRGHQGLALGLQDDGGRINLQVLEAIRHLSLLLVLRLAGAWTAVSVGLPPWEVTDAAFNI